VSAGEREWFIRLQEILLTKVTVVYSELLLIMPSLLDDSCGVHVNWQCAHLSYKRDRHVSVVFVHISMCIECIKFGKSASKASFWMANLFIVHNIKIIDLISKIRKPSNYLGE